MLLSEILNIYNFGLVHLQKYKEREELNPVVSYLGQNQLNSNSVQANYPILGLNHHHH